MKNNILVICIFMILLLGIGAIAASSDIQSNDTLNQASDDAVSLDDDSIDDLKETNVLSSDKEVLTSNGNDSEVLNADNQDVLNEDNVIYISPNGNGDGSSETSPTKWDNVAMSDGLTIKLLPGTYTNIKSKTIANQITLQGTADGVIFDANQGGRFFTVSASNVVIDNVKFTNGLTTNGPGGAIDWTGAYGKLTNCEFTNNIVRFGSNDNGVGGALHVTGANIFIQNCNFDSNKVDSGTNDGGAVAICGINAIIDGCIFNENTAIKASGASGGAVEIRSTYCTVKNSNFTNNKASWGGAGINVYNTNYASIYNCTFEGNTATSQGGAIKINSGTQSGIYNCTFIDNKASSGGAIYCLGNKPTIFNNFTFINNTATSDGGAGYFGFTLENLNISNTATTFKEGMFNFIETGSSSGGGGGIFYFAGLKNVNFVDCVYENYTAGNGGVFYINSGSDVGFINCNFTNNKAKSGAGGALHIRGVSNLYFENLNFDRNSATTWGGAIYAISSTLKHMNHFNLTNNYAGDAGGALYLDIAINNLNFTNNINGDTEGVFNFNEYNNSAGGRGGLFFIGTANNVNFVDCDFENITGGTGGVLYINSGNNLGFINSNFTGNEAKTGTGGAVFINNVKNIFLEETSFEKNTAKTHGGAMYIQGSSSIKYGYNITINDNFAGDAGGAFCLDYTVANMNFTEDILPAREGIFSFNYNKGSSNGRGGLFYIRVANNVNFVDCSFENITSAYGGAIYINSGNGFGLVNCNFTANEAKTGAGGAVYSNAANFFMENVNVTDNVAGTHGGAIYLGGSSTLNHAFDIVMANNYAKGSGGAICFDFTVKNMNFTTLEDENKENVFIINDDGSHADGNGGLFYFAGVENVNFTDCDFAGYTAGAGGVLYIKSGVDSGLVNCNFTGNEAKTGAGGAVYSNAANFYMENVNVTDNVAGTHGGAIYLGSSTTLKHVFDLAMSNNYAKSSGGAICFDFTVKNMNFTTADGENIVGVFRINDDCSHAGGNGGLFYFAGLNNVNFTECNLSGYTAGARGGVFYTGAAYDLKIINSNFTDNVAKSGGAIHFNSNANNILFSNSNFKGNNATGTGSDGDSEGGAFNFMGAIYNCTFYNVNFTNNTAIRGGGAINTENKITHMYFYDSNFTNNVGGSGGAILLDNSAYGEYIAFDNVCFINNKATMTADMGGHGGAIYFAKPTNHVNLTNIKFINNTALANAGSLYLRDKSTDLQMHNLSFINSHAGGNGGSVCFGYTVENYNFTNTIRSDDKHVVYFEVNNSYAGGSGGVFYFAGAKNINFTECNISGQTGGDGGVLAINNGEHIQVLNSNFTNNNATSSADGCGGVIHFLGPITDCNITNVNFTKNNAKNGGGVLNFKNSIDTLSIKNCEFTNNKGGSGGAIIFDSSSYIAENIIIEDCNFTGQTTSPGTNTGGHCACIYFYKPASNVILNNLNFNNNSAYARTGCIDFYNTVTDLVISNVNANNSKAGSSAGVFGFENVVTNLYLINISVINSSADTHGGVLYMGHDSNNNVHISNFNVINSTSNNNGGVIYLNTAKNVYISNFNATNSKSIKDNGGVIYVSSVNGFYMDNFNITDSYAKKKGGVFYSNSPANHVNVTNGIFVNSKSDSVGGVFEFYTSNYNQNANVLLSNLTVVNASAGGEAGTICLDNVENIEISNVYAINSTSKKAGGFIYAQELKNGDFHNITLINATSDTTGGFLYFTSTVTNLNLTDINVTNATAKTSTAGIYIGGSAIKLSLNNVNFTNTQTNRDNGGVVYVGGGASDDISINNTIFNMHDANSLKTGGFVYINNCGDLIINNTQFLNDHILKISDNGGVIYIGAGNSVLISNSKFTNTELTGNYKKGGAVYIGVVKGDILITNSSFENHTISGNTGNGAGVYATNANSFNVNNSSFINTNAKGATSDGGAIYLTGTVNSCGFDKLIVINSSATQYGGAIYYDYHTPVEITNSAFENVTSNDGGIYFKNVLNDILIRNDNFTNNLANNNGGALYFNGEASRNIIIIDSNFDMCNASNNGGAIYFNGVINSQIEKSNFTNGNAKDGGALYTTGTHISVIESKFINYTAVTGGAIYWTGTYGKIIDSEFINNTASNGGAVYAAQTSRFINITSSKFDKNNASENGGALYLLSNDGNVYKCNFTDNHAGIDGGAIYLDSRLFNIKESNFKNNTVSRNGGSIYLKGESNKVVDSTFVENHAKDGAGVYVYVNNKHVIENSTFLRNVAVEDGGAVYFCIGSAPSEHYVDWNLFKENGIKDPNTGRVTWYESPALKKYAYVLNCYFEENIDYLMEVKAVSSGSSVGVVEVYLPRGINKGVDPETGAVMTIKVTDENGTVVYEGTQDYIEDGFATFTTGPLPIGKYYAQVRFYDDNHLEKYNNNIFTGIENFTIIEIVETIGDFQLIQNLIDEAIRNNQSELQLNRSYKFSIGLDHGQVIINASIKITGNGMITIDALEKCRIFYVNSTNVTLENLRLVNGKADGEYNDSTFNGGAILWNGENGTINNCELENNYAYNGGAVFIQGNTTNGRISNSIFKSNIAEHNGGAIDWNATGGVLESSTLSDNRAYNGGAVFVGKSTTAGLIKSSTFINNTAEYHGGAVNWNATYGNITDSIFISNEANYGGAVFRGSDASKGYSTGNTFIGNHAFVNGGAVDWNASAGRVENSLYVNNTADGNGGAIFVGANSTESYIKNSVFIGNNASGRGGAVDWYASTGTIEESSFTNNHADYGGAVFVGKQTGGSRIIKSNFTLNTANHNGGAIDWNATYGNITDSIFISNEARYGGAVFRGSDASEGYSSGNTFIGNHAFVNGGAVDWNASAGKVENSLYVNNTADGNGGAIFVGANSTESYVKTSVFIGNTANGRGGAIDWYASSGDVENSNFTNNHADYGGAIFVGHETHNGLINNSIFTSNTANVKGGAIDWNASTGDVENSIFNYNHADYGGAIFVGTETQGGKIINSTFNYNDADIKGGAVDWNATGGEIMDSRFNHNSAVYGGAVYVGASSEKGLINNSNFTANSATRGGAIDWNASNGNVTGSRFESNTAVDGGAIFVGHGAERGTITYSEFILNKASNYGGAILFNNITNATIHNSKFNSNEANHGGAVYVDNCTNLLINSSEFTLNKADNDGAVHWAGENGEIVNTTFAKNTATHNAGAIGWKGTEGMIDNVTFNQNTAGEKGGAIFWYGDDTDSIKNALFTHNTANEGGAIYWKGGDGGIIENSTFSYNAGFETAGAVLIFNNTKGTVKNSTFNNNQAPGHYSPERIQYGNGGAIGLIDTYEFNIANATLNNNYANLNGGAIYNYNSNTSKLYNLTFNNNEAGKGGTIAAIGSDNFTLNLSTIKKSVAHDEGGAIFINATNGEILNTEFDTVSSTYAQAGAIYVNGNFTIDNATFANYNSYHNQASAILFDGGNSTLVNSTLSGINAVKINDGAVVYLTKNNITESGAGDYSVLNLGDLYLCKNNFDNVIINDGIIWTQTYTVVMNGENVTVTAGSDVGLNATIVDDNNNVIVSGSFKFYDQTSSRYINSTYSNRYNYGTYEKVNEGVYIINATDTGLKKNNVTVGRLIVKCITHVNITVNQTNEGEIVVIKATLSEKGSNEYRGNVTFNVNGKVETAFVENGVATLRLYNLTAGTYTVTATYNGDDYHFNATNNTLFVVKLRQAFINITVKNIILGQNTTAIATTNANGTVTFIFKGKEYTVDIINGTAKLQLNATDLTEARNYTISVSNNENQYYKSALNSTTFNVAKFNTTITANVTPVIKVFENELINVSVNASAKGVITITINGTEYSSEIHEGIAKFNITGLKKGNYTSVTVKYAGDARFNGNSTNISFEVIPTDDYNITVNVGDIKYGENATVTVTLPSDAKGNVTIYVDDVKYENVPIVNGIATLKTTHKLEVGKHTVNVTYIGDDNYAPKDNNASSFNVTATDKWDLNLTVEAHEYGKDTIINVTLPDNAQENVTLTIDGKNYTVKLTDGKGSLVLNNLSAGLHEITAKYPGDENYTAKSVSDKFHISQITPTIIINTNPIKVGQNATITITIPENVTGNVTIYVADQNFTRKVIGHKIVLNVTGLKYGNHSIVVNYEGDVNHTKASNSTNITVEKYSPSLNITIDKLIHMVEDTFTINVTNGTIVNVTINGVEYPLNADGTVNITTSTLNAGEYIVTATIRESEMYYANSTTLTFNMIKYNSTVDIQVIPDMVHYVGDNFIINITNNTVATVTINGVNYIINSNGNVNIDTTRLLAGNYTIVAQTPESKKFNGNSTNITISIIKKHSNVTIDVNKTYVIGSEFNITVTNSSVVNVTVNGVSYPVVDDRVVIDTVDLTAGKYVVIATIYENDYYFGNTTTKTFEIIKKNSTVSVEIIPNNSTFFVGSDFIIHVTNNTVAKVTINGKEYNIKANGNVDIDTTKLMAGNYTVVVTVPESREYYANSTNESFVIAKQKSNVTVDVNKTYVIGSEFNITITNSSVVNVTVNGVSYPVVDGRVVIDTANLSAGKYVVIATIYENDYYFGNTTTKTFEIIKKNSTVSVEIIPNNGTFFVGSDFVINVTNNTVAKVTINGKEYNIKANGNVDIDTTKLLAGSYNVTVTVPENDYYYGNSSSVNFTIVKQKSNVTIDVNKTYVIGSEFNVTVTNSSIVKVTINGEDVAVNADGTLNITSTELAAGKYVVIATIYENDKFYGNTTTKTFEIIKKNSTVSVEIIPGKDTFFVGSDFIIHVTNSTAAKVTINGKEYSVKANGNVDIDTIKLLAGNYTVSVTVPENDYYYGNTSSVNFTVVKQKSNVTIEVNKSYVIGSEFNITITNSSVVNVTVNGVSYPVVDGRVVIDTAELTAGKYVVIATIYENDYYFANSTTKTFEIIKKNSTVNVVIIPDNGTFFVGSDFIIHVTNSTAAKVTINGKEYAIKANGNVDIDTTKLLAGNYTVVVTVPENRDYYSNSSSVNFTVVKQKSNVTINVNKTYVIGSEFNVTVTNSSIVKVTINGEDVAVNADGTLNFTSIELAAGKYVVIATIYENDKFYGNTTTQTFEIIKKNSTVSVEIIPGKDTFFVGSDFIIHVTNSTAAKVTVNGKEYAIKANGNVDIDTTKLLADNYNVTVTVPENDYYYGNSSSVNFTVVKQKSNVTVDVDDIYVIGSEFNITITNSSQANVTVNGVSYPVVNGKVVIDTAKLSAGKYVVIATIYENDYCLANTTTKTFEIIKMNSTVSVEVIPANGTFFVGSDFIINVTNNTAAKVTINGKEYAIKANGNVEIDTAKLLAGNYTVLVTVPENDYYYGNSSTVNFTIAKRPSIVSITVGESYVYGTLFNITVENNTAVNVTINGKAVKVNADGTLDIDSTTMAATHYVVIATIYENDKYLGSVDTKEFDITKLNSSVNITITPNTTHVYGDEFTIKVENNTNVTVTINGDKYDLTSEGNVIVDTTKLPAGDYTIIASIAENPKYYANVSTMKFSIIKLNSSVNITVGDSYIYGSKFNITVENNTAVNVTINGKEVKVNADGTLDIDSTTMAAAHYVVIATIYENAKYYGSVATREFNITKLASSVNITIEPDTTHVYGDKFTIKVENNTKATVTINGDEYAILPDGTVNVTTSTLAAGDYTVIASIPENAKYMPNSSTVKFSIIKLPSSVNITVGDSYIYGSKFNITVENNTAVNVTINGKEVKVNADGTLDIDSTTMAAAHYVVIATIYENAKYYGNVSTKEFNITKLASHVNITIDPDTTHVFGDKFTIKVANDTAAVVTINGDEYDLVDGVVDVDTSKLPAGDYTIIASIPENAKYLPNSSTLKFTIIKLPSSVNITIDPNSTHYVGDKITIKVENNTAATVTINSKSYKINADGTVDVDTSKFAAGEYRVTASIAENDKYFANQTTAIFKITKYNSTVIASAKDINYRDDEIITVNVPKEQTGYVNVVVNNKTYSGKIRNGEATINITGLAAGEYNVAVNYEGDDKYFESSNATSFKVSKTDLIVGTDSNATANVVGQDVTNKENATFIVTVPQDFKGKVNITVDNETYSGDADSIIKMAPLTSGDKVAKVTLWNDSNYNDATFDVPFKVRNVTEAANITTIKTDNLTRGYNSQYDFQATFLDSDGKALVNTEVEFVIDGKTYTVKTNGDGIAQLTTSKLAVGTYNVTSINTATGESTVNKLEIVKRIIKNKDMTLDFLSGKYYVVQVIGDDGKPVGAGEIVDIYANTIHYVAKTDKNGYARLKINLNPKTYYFHAEYKTFKTNKNKIVVKQTLKLVKKTVKVKKGKKIVLKAKLKWSNGKAIKGKKIVFKFKGKKYSAKTNKKGIAKVTIKKKSVLKKLKKGKSYKFTAAYKTNKVKGKVKVKK